MDRMLGNLTGGNTIAKIAGEKVGELVEDTVTKVMGGNEEKKEEEKKGGGFNVGDALSLVGGKTEGQGGGLDVKDAIGGFFK